MVVRAARPLAVWALALGLSGLAVADEGEPVLSYAEAAGNAPVGLFGAGVEGVDLAVVAFVPNASHPRLQLLLDYEPTNLSAEAGPASLGLLYEFRVDLRDGKTGETLASFPFVQPGERYFALNVTSVDGRPFLADVYARVGVDVDWTLSVRGWRSPEPI